VTRLAIKKASFLKYNDINDISFYLNACLSLLLFYSVSGNANSMVKYVLCQGKWGEVAVRSPGRGYDHDGVFRRGLLRLSVSNTLVISSFSYPYPSK
jgi:hypothetical protein